jgi:hypothetical protein
MIRRVRKAIPEAAAAVVIGDDYEQTSGKPACAWNDPVARDELVSRLVNDALAVLAAVDGIVLDETQQQLVITPSHSTGGQFRRYAGNKESTLCPTQPSEPPDGTSARPQPGGAALSAVVH